MAPNFSPIAPLVSTAASTPFLRIPHHLGKGGAVVNHEVLGGILKR
jgi:hypothetical protein